MHESTDNYSQFRRVPSPLEKPIRLSPNDFGYSVGGDGQGVNITLLDSGVPIHHDLKSPLHAQDFISDGSLTDNLGHATLITGILSANDPAGLTGLCPRSQISHGKIINDKGESRYESLAAGLLWGAINGSDIILVTLCSNSRSHLLDQTISKLRSKGVIVVSDTITGNDYPASVEGVVPPIAGKKASVLTTLGNDEYAFFSGTGVGATVTVGLIARIISSRKKKNMTIYQEEVIKDLLSSFKNKENTNGSEG